MDSAPLSCLDNEEDEPPPLEDMSDVLKKMHVDCDKQIGETCCPTLEQEPAKGDVQQVCKKVVRRTEDKTSLVSMEPTDPVLITPDARKAAPPPPLKPLKRGFFNTKPMQPQPLQAKPKVKEAKEEIPIIRPSKPLKGQHNKIPEFMRVDQDPSRIKLQQEVRDMLKPTQELVKDVMETTDIRTGLEDPEIMAAVSEIAGNPDAMHKYKHNKKVTAFYNQLGKLMSDRIQKQEQASGSLKRSRTPKK